MREAHPLITISIINTNSIFVKCPPRSFKIVFVIATTSILLAYRFFFPNQLSSVGVSLSFEFYFLLSYELFIISSVIILTITPANILNFPGSLNNIADRPHHLIDPFFLFFIFHSILSLRLIIPISFSLPLIIFLSFVFFVASSLRLLLFEMFQSGAVVLEQFGLLFQHFVLLFDQFVLVLDAGCQNIEHFFVVVLHKIYQVRFNY